jgi:glycosyltransferase involved in cell wall biosynthesis
MRVAEVIVTFPPYPGGMGYVCFYNARELARRGHEVTVFTLDYGRMNYENDPDDFKIVRLRPALSYGDAGIVPQLYSMLKDFDIVHLHYPFFGGAEYVYLSSLLRGQKYFLTYHMDVFGDTLLKKLVLRAYEPVFLKRIINRADRIGAINMEHLKSSKIAGLVDWDKVVEVFNGVDVERFQPREKDTALLKKYGLENKVVVLFVGNLYPYKRLDVLIDAVSKIDDKRIVLLVVGGGYKEMEFRAYANDRGMRDRVIFAGRVSDEDLPHYYNLGDFLVLPSTYPESFGLVVLEAMASGKPAIVSSLPGPSQLVEEGRDGLLVKVGDVEDLKNKIEYLAYDKERCRLMGEAARKKVIEKYSWEKIGELLEKTLQEIVNV